MQIKPNSLPTSQLLDEWQSQGMAAEVTICNQRVATSYDLPGAPRLGEGVGMRGARLMGGRRGKNVRGPNILFWSTHPREWLAVSVVLGTIYG